MSASGNLEKGVRFSLGRPHGWGLFVTGHLSLRFPLTSKEQTDHSQTLSKGIEISEKVNLVRILSSTNILFVSCLFSDGTTERMWSVTSSTGLTKVLTYYITTSVSKRTENPDVELVDFKRHGSLDDRTGRMFTTEHEPFL